MSERNLIIITKIIFFYSLFFIGVKIFLIFRGAWVIPNLFLILPFLGLALASGLMMKREKYSKIFAVIAAAVIVLVRIYENNLVFWIKDVIN